MNTPLKNQLKGANPEENEVKNRNLIRTHHIGVRVNDAEFALLNSLAEKNDKQLVEFVRETALAYDTNDTDEVRFKVLCGVIENMNEKVLEVLKYVKK